MQLHAWLLLFIITTDKTLALSLPHCGGNVSLDKEPAGHINLTLPGLFTDINNTLNLTNNQSVETPLLSVCTWTLSLPQGQTVILESAWLESGSGVSVRCVWKDKDQILESEGATLLSGCDGNKATFTWTGAKHSSHVIQLFYYVQEDERNSSEDHTSPHSGQDLLRWSQTGTSFTGTALVGQEAVRGTERGTGRLYEGLEQSSAAQSASSPSSQDQGLLLPTSPLQGLSVAERADRETLPLPEERPNNGADTSGAAHLADAELSARARTHPYFQHTLHTDTLFHTANTQTNTRNEPPQTQMALKHESSSSTLHGTDKHINTATQTSEISVKTQAHPTSSSSSLPPLTSSPPERPSLTTLEGGTTLIPHGGAVSAVSGVKLPHSWRSHRSTNRLNLDLSSAFTSDPLKSPTDPQQDGTISTHADTEPTASSSQNPSRTHPSTAHLIGLDTPVGTVEAASSHLNISQTDSSVPAASDATNQTAAFETSDTSENTETLHTSATQTQTNSPQSTESLTPPHTSPLLTQTSKEERQTATQSTDRNLSKAYMTTETVSSLPNVNTVEEPTLSFTGFSSTPRAALTLGDVLHISTATGITTETYTLRPTYTLLDNNWPTNSPTPAPVLHSSTPSYTLKTHTTSPGSSRFTHTLLPLPSTTTESSTHTPLIDHKITSIPSQTVKSHTPHTQRNLPLPSSTNVPLTHTQPHNYNTQTHTPLLSLTTAKSDYELEDKEAEKEDESWQRFPSSTTAQTPTAGAPTTHPTQENHLAITPSALTSTMSYTTQTPKFYIVPDQPAAIRVESIELLLQIVVEESRSAFTSGLEEDTVAWVEPYLQRAPGFSRLLGVWSSGHAVQSLVEFKTSGALQWLGMTGPTSLLEQTGLSQAVWDGRSFRSSKITNITLGGLQGDVCDWLLQCPAGYRVCVSARHF
ncbi:mucin-5AC isoform X1 [Plectropomus leopardus]|uniref:mucin-5AC isoform X1 n=1 Tax=Plectropomus leopardus TaxID=160734 RepID=UPI001C4BABC3|nr:mucin-5AC isoform X1 [Plectropomus leopardus]